MSDSFFTPPSVTPFVECPNCKRLIEYGVGTCPSCREQIGSEYARASAGIVGTNTQACSLANTIKSAEPAVAILSVVSLFALIAGGSAPLLGGFVSPVFYIAAIGFWFFRYRQFHMRDEEFTRARRDLIKSLKLWVALLIVQILLLAYFISR